jgi:hypothetical protein
VLTGTQPDGGRPAWGARGRADEVKNMRRRKLLVGVGALAAGSGAVLGSGATFNQVNDRSASIDVVSDNPAGIIGFNDTSPGDVVNLTSNKIEIDFAEAGADGVNVGGEYALGDANDDQYGTYINNPAFTFTNQAPNTTVDYEVEYKLTGGLHTNGSYMKVHFTHTNDNNYELLEVSGGAGSGDTFSRDENSHGSGVSNSALAGHEPGDVMNVGIYINTDQPNSSVDEDLSGNLTITATPD